MAKLQIRGVGQVQQNSGPTVLNQNTATGADFGGGVFNEVERATTALADKLQNQVDIAQSNKMKNEQYEAKNQMVSDYLQNSKGENAMHDAAELKERMQAWDDEYSQNVPERYKATFQQQSATSNLDWDRVVQRHQISEAEKFKVAEHQATQKNALAFIGNNYSDPALVNENIRESKERQIAYDRANGQSNDVVKANALAVTTAGRLTVADQMIGAQSYQGALDYIHKHAAEIDPAERVKYERSIGNAIKSRSNASKTQYSNQLKDYLAYLSDGNEPQPGRYTKEQLVSVLGKDKGQEAYEQVKDYEDYATKRGEIKDLSYTELTDLLTKEKPTEVKGYRQEATQFTALQRAAAARTKELAQDPAKYVITNSPMIQSEHKKAKDSGNYENYASAMVSEQTRLGVPPQFTKVLDTQSAKNMVLKYNEGGESAAQFVEGLKNSYGKYFPQVMKELSQQKLPENAITVAVLGSSPAATYLSQADKVGFKTLKENIGNDDYKSVSSSVNDNLSSEFTDTLIGLGNNTTIKNQIQKSAETLAMYYLDNGMADSASDAANKATKQIIDDRYEFRFSGSTMGFGGNAYRVPVEVNGEKVDTDKVDKSLDALIDVLPKMSLMSPADSRIKSDELREKLYKRRLQPRWLTRGDDAGVELVDQNNVPVLTADGKKLFYSWGDLEDLNIDEMKKMYEGFK
ncbi:hypothetical protein ABKY54_004545 [Vibrio harveyi]